MKLAREKFLELLKHVSKLEEKGVRIRMIGEVELLPPDVRQPAAELEHKTRRNSQAMSNL